jgi:fatty-acyl-CoA synthase
MNALSIFDENLDRNSANYAPLSPVRFVERSAEIFGERIAVIHGRRRYTWEEVGYRTARLSSALRALGVRRGTTVSTMLANTPEMIEAHYAVPALGATLNTLNTRLDARSIAWQMGHCETRILITDREFSPTVQSALDILARERGDVPIVIDVDDSEYAGEGRRLGAHEYEALLAEHQPVSSLEGPSDEWDAIAISYTSGTTGDPKGVVTHHRGAYLSAVSNVVAWSMPKFPVYLWTLPMFHCNGWSFPWAIALQAGTHVCLRRYDVATILSAISEHRVDHYCAAPVVHNLICTADPSLRAGIDHVVRAFSGGAALPTSLIEGMAKLGFELTQVYGLTEVYGPATVCTVPPRWETLPPAEQARLKGRQGIRYALQDGMKVMDPVTMREVPADGRTTGEIMYRGNLTMKGYLKNPSATEAAFKGGWFHTGDIAVIDPDRYVAIKDRSKDIIISGGENISSLEIEEALHRHPAVFMCAVVAKPDDKWGEVPLAFVELKPGATATAEELIEHCRSLIARYKVPKEIRFEEIPKTPTGKVLKYSLREQLKLT